MEFLKVLEGIRTPALNAVFEFITHAGEELILLGIICAMYWCINKKLAYRMAFGYFISGLAVQVLKITFRIPRPWVRDTSFTPVEGALENATGYSFPSGHTQSATTMFGTLALNTKKRVWQVVCVILIALVMLSRMYLGVHTPADVLVGFALTTVIIVAVQLVSQRMKMTETKRAVIAIILALIAIAVIIYPIVLYNQGVIAENYASDSCKAGGAGLGFALSWYIETKYINFEERKISLPWQIVKFAVGLAGVLAAKEGLKLVLGSSMAASASRYAIMVIWAMMIFPVIIKWGVKKLEKKKA